MAAWLRYFCASLILLYLTHAQFHRKCPKLIQPKFVPVGCDWQLVTVRNCKWFNLTCPQDADVSCFRSDACNNASSFTFNKYSGKCELASNVNPSNASCIANNGSSRGFPSIEDCERKCGPPNVIPFAANDSKWVGLTSISIDLTSATASTIVSSETNSTTAATATRTVKGFAVAHSVDKLELCRGEFNSSLDCKPEKRFFFNRTNGSCQESLAHMCPNEHNFATMDECRATCDDIEPCPVYEMPPAKENCRIIFIDGDDYCPEPEEVCNTTATRPPSMTEEDKLKKCRSYEPKDDGECAAKSAPVYYYDRIGAVCVKKIVCSKADDLFKTKEECNEICSSVPPCPLFAVPIIGPGCRIEHGDVDRNFCPSPPIVNCTAPINITTTKITSTDKPSSLASTTFTVSSNVTESISI